MCAKSREGSQISVTEVGNNGANDVANCFVNDCDPFRNFCPIDPFRRFCSITLSISSSTGLSVVGELAPPLHPPLQDLVGATPTPLVLEHRKI
jgi:hypothetical protein